MFEWNDAEFDRYGATGWPWSEFTHDDADAVLRLLIDCQADAQGHGLSVAEIVGKTGVAIERLYAMPGCLYADSYALCRTCKPDALDNRFWIECDPVRLFAMARRCRERVHRFKAEEALYHGLAERVSALIRQEPERIAQATEEGGDA